MDLTPEEKVALVRTLLSSKGWMLYEGAMNDKFEQVRDQAFLPEKDRHSDYKDWSMDKITGMVYGLGWARKVLPEWLRQYEAMERAAQEAPQEEVGHGHPYVNDMAEQP